MDNNNQIIIYQTDDDQTQIDVCLENEEPGEFHVWIAPNAAEGTPAKFILQD